MAALNISKKQVCRLCYSWFHRHNLSFQRHERQPTHGDVDARIYGHLRCAPTASVINIDPVVSGKHVGIRSSLQEQTRSASARRRSMPDQRTGSIIMNTAVGLLFAPAEVSNSLLLTFGLLALLLV